ncbi:MAG: hypothetical protein Q4F50_11725 [Bacteroides sp.]|uniref:hypothetical protein n=1 Tax=Bacteroides sp. TaxID=29523 RepID=UPI0026E083A9|nr:hypothetical protein [Bacteroides sp.]MDO5420718.1 hypothetical protein [Bacteroides sp.]
MKYGTVTRLLAAAYVVIVQLTGCSPDTEELEKFPQAIPIRIVAEMNKGGRYFPGGGGGFTFIRGMEGELYRCGGI